MKKITLVLALLVVASFAFGQIEATVDGDATLTWGVDLETNATGFTNAASATIDFDLVSTASEELTGDAVYGSIKLADFSAVVDETDGLVVTAPSVTAKLLLTDAISMAIYGAPGFSLNNAIGILHIGADDDTELNAVTGAVAGTTGGFSLTYDFGDMGSATVKAASHGSWDTVAGSDAVAAEYGWLDDTGTAADTTDDVELDGTAAATGTAYWGMTAAAVAAGAATDNSDNLYSAGLDVTLTPMDMLSVGLGLVYGDFNAADLGVTATLALDPVDMFGVWAKLDGAMPNAGDFDFDTSFGADVTLDAATLNVAGYYGAEDLEVGIDAALLAVENLTLTAAFDLYTLIAAAGPWAAQVSLSYDIGGIKPYATIDLDSDNVTGINAGVELTGQVPNTTFKIDWHTDDVSNDTGDVEASIKIAF